MQGIEETALHIKNMIKNENNILISFSAHIHTDRENIGDILSARAIKKLFNLDNAELLCLRDNIKKSQAYIIYGGGGMIRPNFSKREVFLDKNRENNVYGIYGVGLNRDYYSPEYDAQDLNAIRSWVNGAKFTYVRDIDTKAFLDKIGCEDVKVRPCPTFDVIKDLSVNLDIEKKYLLGIVPSFGHTHSYKSFLDQTVSLINDSIDSLSQENISIICHDNADAAYIQNIYKDIKISVPKTFEEVYVAYKACERIITTRAHGVIFSAACGIKCSPIILSDKIRYLYKLHYKEDPPTGISFDIKNHL